VAVRSFIDDVLEEWGMTIPDLGATDRKTVTAWLGEKKLETALHAANNVTIAVAFGQAKITGRLDDAVVALARAALDREEIVVEDRERRDPTWSHAQAAKAATKLKRAALANLEKTR
jgi:uncharacterized protein YfeS